MKTKSINRILVLMVAVSFIAACRKDFNFTPTKIDAPPPPPPGAYQISFSQRIKPIFSASTSDKCTDCHGAGGTKPDLATNPYTSLFEPADSGTPPIDTVANQGNPAGNSLYQKVKSGGSMNGYLPQQSDADSILLWLQQGAKNN